MPHPLATEADAAHGYANVADEVRADEQAVVQPTLVVSRHTWVADSAQQESLQPPTDTDAAPAANAAPPTPADWHSKPLYAEQRDSLAYADGSESAAPAASAVAQSIRSKPLVGPNSTTLYDPNPRVAPPWHAVAEPRRARGYAASPHQQPQPRQPRSAPTQVPWHVAATWGDTTLHIESNTAAGASYIFWWISGLLVYFNERNNRYVRFHAMQSILLSGAMTVFAVLTSILVALCWDVAARTQLQVLYALGNGIAVLAVVTLLMVWIGTMVAAWTGHLIRLPIIGEYAERYSAPAMQVSPPLDD